MTQLSRIRSIVDAFLRSEYFVNWQAEQIESGGYSRPESDARDRYERCYAAAEHGADGSTHAEHIADMRAAFRDFLRTRGGRTLSQRKYPQRSWRTEYPYRVEAAVDAYWNDLEQWHARNGSLDQEVG